MKTCSKCKTEKHEFEFSKMRSSGDGLYPSCRACKKTSAQKAYRTNKERYREYSKNWYKENCESIKKRIAEYKLSEHGQNVYNKWKESPKGRDVKRALNKKWRDNNLFKKHAQDALYKAIKKGRIKKPESCEMCRITGPLIGHHWSYKKEHRLDVKWLCKKCHYKIHDELNKAKAEPATGR